MFKQRLSQAVSLAVACVLAFTFGETHGFGFPCVVATCVHERARSNRAVRRTHTQAQNTQRPGEPRDLSPLYQFTQPPRRPLLQLERGLWAAFHACMCPHMPTAHEPPF